MKNKTIKNIAAVCVGTALFFILGRFVTIPSPVPNTSINLQYGLLAFMGAALGPAAGFIIGLLGHALIYFSYGWGIWWSWVIASAIFGLSLGFSKKVLKFYEGGFVKKKLISFNLFQAFGHIVAWGIIAPVLDILIYAEPAHKLFTQDFLTGISNIMTTAVIGTLLCYAYSITVLKKDGLETEN